jgi:hypothetical protein
MPVISLSSACHQPVIRLSSACHPPVISLSSACHQPVISLSSACHQPVISLVSAWHQPGISLASAVSSRLFAHASAHPHQPIGRVFQTLCACPCHRWAGCSPKVFALPALLGTASSVPQGRSACLPLPGGGASASCWPLRASSSERAAPSCRPLFGDGPSLFLTSCRDCCIQCVDHSHGSQV